ncbi:MAG TPA: hypothetical protein VJ725_30840 [Thermoanaerobaculia bacterium]|nr:hypothetical protein [Thermoanaerobaculia bacterium]
MIDEARATALHEAAMGYAHAALAASTPEESLRLTRLAFQAEKQAAEMLAGEPKEEPTRSILYRSAANLARQCGEFEEALRLINFGLAGHPPPDVAEELSELWELVRFERRLATNNIQLQREDFQLTVSGDGVAPGVVGEAFISRFRVAQKLFLRVAKAVLSRSSTDKDMREQMRFYIAVAEPGSFVVTIRIGRVKQLPLLEEEDQTAKIIDELIACAEWFEESSEEELKIKIPDNDYRRDLRQLFDQFAPDGKDVALVGLARSRGGETRKAAITRKRVIPIEDLVAAEEREKEKRRRTVFRGTLLFADEMAKRPQIRIRDAGGESQPLRVSPDMMDDVVKQLWGQQVIAIVEWKSARAKTPTLREIYAERT